ncbi:MAG: hypothetical protein ACLFVU_06025 [Phycisphaerae bacterium]
MSSFVILTGPSCVGKGPLHKALKRHHSDQAESLEKLVLFNSRSSRPGEEDGVDYHFRSRDEIETFRDDDDYIVMDVRGDLQAVHLPALSEAAGREVAFYEGNPFVAAALLDAPLPDGTEVISVFLSPLSQREILYLKQQSADVERLVADFMRRKLLRRTRNQKTLLSLPDLENVERRCTSAFREMRYAPRFKWVLPNHDGEDSENWDAFYYPLGDAFHAVEGLSALLDGRVPDRAEQWQEDLLGKPE